MGAFLWVPAAKPSIVKVHKKGQFPPISATMFFKIVLCAAMLGVTLAADCSKAEDPQVCTGSFCQDVNDADLAESICPTFCGFCGSNPTSAPGTPTSTCPAGWDGFSGSCYDYQPNALTFFEALIACQTIGGWLVEVTSAAENTFVSDLARQKEPDHQPGRPEVEHSIWMGLEDFAVEGTYNLATTKTAATYFSWRQGQPNDRDNNEDCVAMYARDGMWFDSNCESREAYVCEMAASAPAVAPVGK